jgi:outer membrane usher protein FimD/PapC
MPSSAACWYRSGYGSVLFDLGRLRSLSSPDTDAAPLSIRYDYNVSKRSMLYTGAAWIRNDVNARLGINGNIGALMAVAACRDPRSLIAGVRHTF